LLAELLHDEHLQVLLVCETALINNGINFDGISLNLLSDTILITFRVCRIFQPLV
jgi:hypothetical protein